MTDLPKIIQFIRGRAGFCGSHYTVPPRSLMELKDLPLHLVGVLLDDSPHLSALCLLPLSKQVSSLSVTSLCWGSLHPNTGFKGYEVVSISPQLGTTPKCKPASELWGWLRPLLWLHHSLTSPLAQSHFLPFAFSFANGDSQEYALINFLYTNLWFKVWFSGNPT